MKTGTSMRKSAFIFFLFMASLVNPVSGQPGGGGDPGAGGGGEPVPITGIEILLTVGAMLGLWKGLSNRKNKQ